MTALLDAEPALPAGVGEVVLDALHGDGDRVGGVVVRPDLEGRRIADEAGTEELDRLDAYKRRLAAVTTVKLCSIDPEPAPAFRRRTIRAVSP
jgi:hypothetical protein